MTPRPGTVQRVVEVKLRRSRDRKLKVSDEFMEYVRILHTEHERLGAGVGPR